MPFDLTLDATDKIENAEMAAVVAGKPNLSVLTEIDLQELAERFRLQRIIFEVARDVYEQIKPTWKGTKENLLAQVIRLVEKFIGSAKLQIDPPLFYQDELKRRVILTLNMNRIVQHVFQGIREASTSKVRRASWMPCGSASTKSRGLRSRSRRPPGRLRSP